MYFVSISLYRRYSLPNMTSKKRLYIIIQHS